MNFYDHYFLHRTMCDVLAEIHTCHKTRNYANLQSLVEEVQSMGNRMEAELASIKDFKELHRDIKDLKKELRELKEKKEELT